MHVLNIGGYSLLAVNCPDACFVVAYDFIFDVLSDFYVFIVVQLTGEHDDELLECRSVVPFKLVCGCEKSLAVRCPAW